MDDAFDYAKQKWHKSHKVPDLKVGDVVLDSTLSFNNIKGPKKVEDSHQGKSRVNRRRLTSRRTA
ncbi:hypothetical protein O181_121145, partial [Austropuccinia psidii MF-1]|nr:hypothetical protein [Austropuccinia psidii MF-1]